MSVKIIVDSTCDFDPEERQALGIEMIPLTVQFGEEIFRDGIDITKKEFFQRLRASKELPHTSQINPATFLEVYERLGADGSELLVMTISKNLSGTYQSACGSRAVYRQDPGSGQLSGYHRLCHDGTDRLPHAGRRPSSG